MVLRTIQPPSSHNYIYLDVLSSTPKNLHELHSPKKTNARNTKQQQVVFLSQNKKNNYYVVLILSTRKCCLVQLARNHGAESNRN